MSADRLPSKVHRPVRVAIVGAGNVGSTFAYALLLSGLASEIVLIDANRAKAEGEAMDLIHAVPFTHPTRVWAGDWADCAGAVVTVLTAGAGQKPGETRLDLVKKNAAIWRDIVPKIVHHNPDGMAAGRHQPGRRADLRCLEALRSARGARHRFGHDFGHGALSASP